MSEYFDKEKVQKAIACAVDKIISEVDPRQLDEYYRLFKKEVPLFHRSKVAAYLLMLCDQGKDLRFTGTRSSGAAARSSGFTLAEEESKRLFFNIGRSRRVFPREILGLINAKTAIKREDIGAIRIFDNYSFVQVRDSVTEKIISALHGTVFRGKPLVVNYAKSRKDENEDELDKAASSEQRQHDAEEEDI